MDILREKVIVVASADAPSREAVTGELQRSGGQVLAVAGAFEAYELVRDRQVDAVVTSSRLSNGDSLALLTEVRRLNHEVPVLLFAAAGEGISQTEALHRGFTAYFLQVFPVEPISAALARSLEFVAERRKRKVERVAVAAFCSLRIDGAPGLEAPVLNLSRGGMFVSLERGFPLAGTEVTFTVSFPPGTGHASLEGRGVVRWVRERTGAGHLPGVGLEFSELSAEARSFLDGYVERNGRRG